MYLEKMDLDDSTSIQVGVIGASLYTKTGEAPGLKEFLEVTREFQDSEGVTLQFLDPEKIVSREHVLLAMYFALQARVKDSNPMISNSLAMEILLYASCQRQIQVALREMGLGPSLKGKGVVCACVFDDPGSFSKVVGFLKNELGAEVWPDLDEKVGLDLARVEEFFGITGEELQVYHQFLECSAVSGLEGDIVDPPGGTGERGAVLTGIIERMVLLSIS
ncbi:MAG: KEOPS complex subunit Cgi121 [Promethearchaeota archaeon]